MNKLLCLIVLAFASMTATAQVTPSDARIAQLQSESIEERKEVSSDVFGAGITDPATYQAIAAVLEAGLAGVTPDSPRLDELAWHAKALGGSGDMAYMPLLERASHTGIRHIDGHARDAKALLKEHAKAGRPYFDYERTRIITEAESAQCRMIRQDVCESRRSTSVCLEEQKDEVAMEGGNSIMYLMTNDKPGIWPFGGGSVVANYYACPR